MLALTRNTLIPLSIRKKIGKMFPPKADVAFEAQLYENRYLGRTGTHIDDKLWLYGAHESATIGLMRTILSKQRAQGLSPVYMDIGTNTGVHLLSVAGLVDRAFGFEPWEVVRERAGANLATNNAQHVSLFDFGLSDVEAMVAFHIPETTNLGVGYFDEAGTNKAALQLRIRRGDDVVAEQGFRPTLIKMDVEGHERRALTGLARTLREAQPDVVFEYNDNPRNDLGDLASLQALFGPKYQFFGIKRSREKPSLAPFSTWRKFENIVATVHPERLQD